MKYSKERYSSTSPDKRLRLEIASKLLKLKKRPWKFTLRSSEIPKYLQEGICLEAVHLGYLFRKRQPVLPRHFSLTETELHQPVYRAIFWYFMWSYEVRWSRKLRHFQLQPNLGARFMIFPSIKLTKVYFALYFEYLKLNCRLFNVGIKAPLYAPIKRQNVEN